MNKPAAILLILLGIVSFSRNANAIQVTGTVFNDQSGDGLQNPGEHGVAKVPISNGHDVVLSDANGKFRIETAPNDFVFVIQPSGWKFPLDSTNRPKFFHRITGDPAANFPLIPQEQPDDFQILVTTDPQVSSEAEIGFYLRSIVEPLSGRKGPAFGVDLGDIVSDHFELFGKMSEATGKIGIPWHNVNGNHDLDFSSPAGQGLSLYKATFGPATYAFEYAKVLFIALDDIRPKPDGSYIGGFTEDQFQFLKNVLAVTPENRRVVLMVHIPLFQNGPFGGETFRRTDRDRLFKILAPRQHVLVLSGHTHAQNHVFYGSSDGWPGKEPLHEYNVAAACGSFWGGKPDQDGIPAATMWDGTPPGCALITFHGNENGQTDYLPSRHDSSFQIGLHAPLSARAGEGWVSFYANVFNGHEGWKVEYKIGEREWQPMRRVEVPDPSYSQAFLAQNSANPPLPWRRLPDPILCRHLWRANLPKDLAPGKQVIEVRASDPSGKEYTAQTQIQLVGK